MKGGERGLSRRKRALAGTKNPPKIAEGPFAGDKGHQWGEVTKIEVIRTGEKVYLSTKPLIIRVPRHGRMNAQTFTVPSQVSIGDICETSPEGAA